jgi:hypothetical protein
LSRWVSANDIVMRDLDDDDPIPEAWRAEFLRAFRTELAPIARFSYLASRREFWSERNIAAVAGVSRRKVREHIGSVQRWMDDYALR